MGWSFFPLDRELGLGSQSCTPTLVEHITFLGTACTSFREARDVLGRLLGVSCAADSVRRITEAHGRSAVALDEAATLALDKDRPQPVASMADRLQQVSADGVMVSLCDGSWEEVKLLAVARIEQTPDGPHACDLSYYARLSDARSFIAGSRLELARRNTDIAREVVFVSDGALWLEGFAEENCPTAQHIIDWPHAVSYLYNAGAALYGSGSADCTAWTNTWADRLWAGEGEAVVAELARLEATAELEEVRAARQYIERRVDLMRYAAFRQCGYPVGSGIAESGNKVVIEDRLKGAGKHWQRENVSPMAALRCLSANALWDSRWTTITHASRRKYARCRLPERRRTHTVGTRLQPPPPAMTKSPPAKINGKPTAAHSWRAPISYRAKT